MFRDSKSGLFQVSLVQLIVCAACAQETAPVDQHDLAGAPATGQSRSQPPSAAGKTLTSGNAGAASQRPLGTARGYADEDPAQQTEVDPNDRYAVVQSYCPEGSLDTDSDGLCDDAEAQYGCDASNVDTDGDSIIDSTEVYGAWTNDGSFIDLPGSGASPLHKDVFLEIDYFPDYAPLQEAVDMVVQAYANAPVYNPDGSTGIHLHAWIDDQITAEEAAAYPVLSTWEQVEALKSTYFRSELASIYHYALFANRTTDDRGDTSGSGYASGIPGQSLIVSLGYWNTTTQVSKLYQQAGTLMHELGHDMGLHHGGHVYASDGSLVASDDNNKPTYLSVMSYVYQMTPFRMNGVDAFDYARFDIGSLSESALNEELGLTPIGDSTREDLAQIDGIQMQYVEGTFATPVAGWASYQLDFNNDGVIGAQISPIDLNGANGSNDVFPNQANDWNNLQYNGLGVVPKGALYADFKACHQATPQ